MSIQSEKAKCLHEDMVLKEELSKGPNILGQEVECMVQRLQCKLCGQLSVKRI